MSTIWTYELNYECVRTIKLYSQEKNLLHITSWLVRREGMHKNVTKFSNHTIWQNPFSILHLGRIYGAPWKAKEWKEGKMQDYEFHN